MKSFKGMTKNIMDAGIDGATLYGAKKGFQVVSTMAKKVLPSTLNPSITGLAVAAGVVLAADMLLPARYARLAGAVAMEQVIERFIDPTVDPVLAKAGLIDTVNIPVALPAATSGYAQKMGSFAENRGMAGYASARTGMGGYTSAMGNAGMIFPSTNAVGLPG